MEPETQNGSPQDINRRRNGDNGNEYLEVFGIRGRVVVGEQTTSSVAWPVESLLRV
jgi:hypothetical protein